MFTLFAILATFAIVFALGVLVNQYVTYLAMVKHREGVKQYSDLPWFVKDHAKHILMDIVILVVTLAAAWLFALMLETNLIYSVLPAVGSTRRIQLRLATAVKALKLQMILQTIRDLPDSTQWKKYSQWFIDFLRDRRPRFTVYTKGNSKLPFYSFSTLPGVTCPGAGSCLSKGFCYSFKAWRYPAAFFRQCQNTVLVATTWGKEILADKLRRIDSRARRNNETVDFRLYVDGDIDSIETAIFWFELLKQLPNVRAYGYSKSLNIFAELIDSGYAFPDNYMLNLSSGSIHKALYDKVATSSVARGKFVVIPLRKLPNETAETFKQRSARWLKTNYGQSFVCPGRCGTCTRNGHACGSERFHGITIGNPIH